jgi:ATP-dependent DNA ligase
MVKVKRIRTADCVVGGFRYASRAKVIGSLLLGLYDRDGLLHHVGFTSSLTADQRSSLTPKLEKLVKAPGFTGRRPGLLASASGASGAGRRARRALPGAAGRACFSR